MVLLLREENFKRSPDLGIRVDKAHDSERIKGKEAPAIIN